jgi:superfamily II DNA or RNA helicase
VSAAAQRPLWPHQAEAVDAAVRTLALHPRTTIVAACGSGKTRVGGEVAQRFVPPDGRLLIVAPTVDLIVQTLRAYRRTYAAQDIGRAIVLCTGADAVYAAEADLEAEYQARVTTDPAELAALLRQRGRATVLSTFHSLGVVQTAHQHGAGAWDQVIVDEAHRCAGAGARAWAVIHDDALIPARRRLYMTATPRLLGERGADLGVGMDQEKIFGPICYRLSFGDAIERGLLAEYRLLVVVVTDAEIHRLVTAAGPEAFLSSGSAAVSPRALAVQVAVLRAAAQHGLRRVITYHHRVQSAHGFAHTLPAAARLLDPAEQPEHLTARYISGYQHMSIRRRVLDMLGCEMPGLVVVSNAQVLREGVDLPGIDAVAFIDARDSAEYTAQAVGRALRTDGQDDKIATVIVPVILGPDQSPESALHAAAFEPVWRAVRALRAHDERLAAGLDKQRRILGRLGAQEYDPEGLPEWMSLTGVPVPAAFAAAISLRMLTETTASWEEHYGRAATYRKQHGHLDVQREQDALLHTWLRNQRSLHQRGELAAERVSLLEALGIVWRVHDEAWQHALDTARAYHIEHGHLRATRADILGSPPVNLGEWLSRQRLRRRAGALGEDQIRALDELGIVWEPQQDAWARGLAAARFFHSENGHLAPDAQHSPFLYTWVNNQRTKHAKGQLAAERAAALDALDIVWKPTDAAWEAGYAAARAYHRVRGNLRARTDATVGEPPYAVGSWLNVQRSKRRNGQLSADRIALLEHLGIVWNPVLDSWTRGLAAARSFHAGHGHLHVRPNEDPALYRWLGDQRERRVQSKLAPARIAALDELDIDWQPARTAWRRAYGHAAEYYRRTGHLEPGPLETVGDPPLSLGRWLVAQRARRRAGTMPAEQVRLLEQIAMVWDVRRSAWERGLAAARAYRTAHGNLDAPRTAVIGTPPYPLGSWLHTLRKDHRADKLAPERAAALSALGMDWNPGRGPRRAAAARTKEA